MTSTDLPDLLSDLRRIALEAGQIIMRIYDRDFGVTQKADDSPVTEADERAEAHILAALAGIAPDIPVVAEEAVAAGHLPAEADRFFLVDPLDGTKSFVKREGEFTVNIALIEDGVPVAGVVLAPAAGRLFYGGGTAAFEEVVDVASLEKDGAGAKCSAAKPIRVRKPQNGEMVGVASRSHNAVASETYFDLYGITQLVPSSSSLKFCLVAAGEADIYPRHGRTMEWDTAAGHAVLKAAGGRVDELDDKPLRYGKFKDGLANPYFVARGG